MHLRKVLTVSAATVLAAGVLGLTATAAQANDPGGDINYVRVGTSTSGAVAVAGSLTGGSASFGGGTFGCSGGSVGGTADAGAAPSNVGHQDYSSLNITCDTPLGVSANISIDDDCATADFVDDNVHDGLLDSYTDNSQGHKYDRVTGLVTLEDGCGQVSAGPCTAEVSGTADAFFDEGDQTLHLTGSNFNLSNQSFFCFGLLTGSVTLNDITFTLSSGDIDFRTLTA